MTPQFYPILLKDHLATATHLGRKTVTRRMNGLERFNINPDAFTSKGIRKTLCTFWREGTPDPNPLKVWHILHSKDGHSNEAKCPYGREPGDFLWVRQSYCYVMREHTSLLEGMTSQFVFRNQVHPDWMEAANEYGYRWKPSIHMPKIACKLWLEITDIKLERLHDITENDAIEEGIESMIIKTTLGQTYIGYRNYLNGNEDPIPYYRNPIDSFRSLWISINGFDSWKLNPWVWVIRFKPTNVRPENFL